MFMPDTSILWRVTILFFLQAENWTISRPQSFLPIAYYDTFLKKKEILRRNILRKFGMEYQGQDSKIGRNNL